MARFIKGTLNGLLNTLGIRYGRLMIDGFIPHEIHNLKQAEIILNDYVHQKILTTDEANRLKHRVMEAGLLPDLKAVLEKIQAFQIPQNLRVSYHFRRCRKAA